MSLSGSQCFSTLLQARRCRNLGLVICNCKEGMLCLHVSDPEARQGLQTAGQRLQIPVKTGVVGAHW